MHTAQKVRVELEALLAEPLQAGFSRRFFAGTASASLAAHRAGANGDAGEAPGAAGRELASATVGLAQALVASRRRGAEPRPGGKGAEPRPGAKGSQAKGPKSAAEIRAAALAAAVAKAAAGKKGRRRGLVVVPRGGPALGRTATGPDALDTLRSAGRR